MNSRILYLLIAVSLTGPLLAQDSQIPPLPPGPVLKRAPNFSTWSVTSQIAPKEKADAKSGDTEGAGSDGREKATIVAKSKVAKTGDIILEQNTDRQGNQFEVWHYKGLRVAKPADAPHPIVFPDLGGGGDIYSINFAAADFAGLDWVSEKTYSGVAKYMDHDCLVFSGTVSPLRAEVRREEATGIAQAKAHGQEAPDELKVPATAYIDVESRLPLVVIFGQEKRIYEYGTPPSAPLALPSDLAATVNEYVQRIKRLSAPAPKAY